MREDERRRNLIDYDSKINRVVIFADLLGFAALTEANPIELEILKKLGGPLAMTFDDVIAPKNALTKAFSSFHLSLESAIRMASLKHTLTAVTFSDSVFVAMQNISEAANFATDLIQSMFSCGVPIRIGIGYGSFAALRFRSDISLNGGEHAAQFLGTAIIRACQAEKCGIKGMRVLLHPSAEPLLGEKSLEASTTLFHSKPVKFLKCSEANSANVRYELNYWDMPATRESKAWRELQDMWSNAPSSEKEHYQATAETINRMRIDHGQIALRTLRRRTLPRRK